MTIARPAAPLLALRFSQAIPVIMAACQIEPSARTAFNARIRQLQRLIASHVDDDRPSGPLAYGLVELAQLATAIRLMAAFMVPTLAARYVIERWEILGPALLAGAGPALPVDYTARRTIGDATILVIAGNALADLGQQGRHDERYAGALGDVEVVAPAELPGVSKILGGTCLILDATAYMPGIVQGFAKAVSATGPELAHELDRLRFTR
ncbi:hypothetical protein [Sphingomonas adhaesiva]|uniref:Uncharacterized protein n=1 Tax=Sphingomonas adhaesiva TaxID=28212 RepID=A0A2A4I5L9_9SPHN|nr:hypothetical protein [Sphingomonas adhaesiva]PCG13083.1 hypothetical protein COA07_16355 [Sphingomonas adhaesiva]